MPNRAKDTSQEHLDMLHDMTFDELLLYCERVASRSITPKYEQSLADERLLVLLQQRKHNEE